MAPRPTPRPTRPVPPAPKPTFEQPSAIKILGSNPMVSMVLFRHGDRPFDQDAPEPLYPLYLLSFPSP